MAPKFLEQGITHLNHLSALPSEFLVEICRKKSTAFLLASVVWEEMLKFHH
jgi:hypothetical protein